jgi:hypothetical protein
MQVDILVGWLRLVVLLKECEFGLVEEEPLLLKHNSLHVFALDIMDSPNIIRQDFLLQFLHFFLDSLALLLVYL